MPNMYPNLPDPNEGNRTASSTTSGRIDPPLSSKIAMEMCQRIINVEYDGNPNKLYEFLNLCDNAMELARGECSETEQNLLFFYIITKLRGDAKRELRTCPERTNIINYESLKNFLLRNFQIEYNIFEELATLCSMKPDSKESVKDFGRRLLATATKLALAQHYELSKNTLMEISNYCSKYVLRNHINKEISLALKHLPEGTPYDELFRIAINESLLQTKVKKYCSNCNNNTHNTVECRRKPTNIIKCAYCHNIGHHISICRKKVYDENRPINTTTPKPINSITKFCKYCKKEGHIINECKKREYNNNKKKEKTESTNLQEEKNYDKSYVTSINSANIVNIEDSKQYYVPFQSEETQSKKANLLMTQVRKSR